MTFLDELKDALTPDPHRNDPPCPPDTTLHSSVNIQSGDNEVYIIRVPYPAVGQATVDFALQLMRPCDTLYYPVAMNPVTPATVYAFSPQGVNLSLPIPSTINNPVFDLVPGQMVKWDTLFNKVYISVNGAGLTGGFIILLACKGLSLVTQAAVQPVLQRKNTIIETTTPLGANGVYTGPWRDSNLDGSTYITASSFANVVGANGGLILQESDDITNPNFTRTFATTAGATNAAFLNRVAGFTRARYWRVQYTNGATPQTTFELTTTSETVTTPLPNQTGTPETGLLTSITLGAASTNNTGFDNVLSANFLPNPLATQNGLEVDIEMYGGRFAGTADLARQGWSAARTPTVFRQVSTAALGSTALWTPGVGNKFRVLRFKIQVTGNASQAVAGNLTIKLLDVAADIGVGHIVFVPGAAGALIGDYDSGWINLGSFGYLAVAVNNALNINLSAALATGLVNVIVAGTEE